MAESPRHPEHFLPVALQDKSVHLLAALLLLLRAALQSHAGMHMWLPLTLSSADLCKGPRGEVEILLRLLRKWPALERVSKGLNMHPETKERKEEGVVGVSGGRQSSVTEANRAPPQGTGVIKQ